MRDQVRRGQMNRALKARLMMSSEFILGVIGSH